MTSVLLNSFYDTMQYSTGWTISYIFLILMTIELIYVMAKYIRDDR